MLKLENVCHSYDDGHVSIDDISLSASKGETLGIIGANGAGKSTLLYLAAGVLFPIKGKITVCGKPLTKSSVKELRAKTGLVFQNSDDQLFTLTVCDDAAFGPRNAGFSEKEAEEKAYAALEMCGITRLAERAPYRISDGEKKLASIAAVIATEPELLLMDEPTASLDPKSRRTVISLLSKLTQTKIISSHDLDMVWDTCHRVIVVGGGRLLADGEAHSILSDEELMFRAGLELPLRLQRLI